MFIHVGQVYQMTTNFEKFVEFNGVLQEWKVLRDEKDAEQVKPSSDKNNYENNSNNNDDKNKIMFDLFQEQ